MQRAQLIGAQSAGVIVLVAGGWVFALVIFSPAYHWDRTSAPIQAAGVLGATMGGLLLLATARCFVRGQTLYLVSVFVTYEVPFREIAAVVDDNGFSVKLRSGRRIGSVAFGSSLIAMVTGNRRGKRAARRLHALGVPTGDGGHEWEQDDVKPRVRFQMIGFALAVIGLMIGYCALGSWK